jgi:hypothetical protein
MNVPTAPRKRGAGFWLLVVGGTGVGCVLLVGGLVFFGALGVLGLAASGDSPSPGASSGANTGASSSADSAASSSTSAGNPPASSGPDDFLYHSANGLDYVADSHVSAEGVAVTLAGEWRDDHRNIVLRLRDDGRYDLASGGGVLVGEKISSSVAYGSGSAERGTWQLVGSTLTLTPEGVEQSGSVGLRQLEATTKAGDGPRQWNVVGVTVQYTRVADGTVRERPGLHITGPSPSWYYPNGDWDLVLRSAPWSGS